MKQQLIQYVELLFAGTKDCEDVKQEILQNTLDRYDDLIAEGKTPEAAYRLAIIGIGDMGEVLGNTAPAAPAVPSSAPVKKEKADTPVKKLLRAVAVGLYILCPVPMFILGNLPGLEVYGLCGVLGMVAVATVLIILGAKKEPEKADSTPKNPKSELQKSIDSMIWAVGLGVYFLVSFLTGAWYITWVMFPIIGAVQGLIKAIMDLKEAGKHEN